MARSVDENTGAVYRNGSHGYQSQARCGVYTLIAHILAIAWVNGIRGLAVHRFVGDGVECVFPEAKYHVHTHTLYSRRLNFASRFG